LKVIMWRSLRLRLLIAIGLVVVVALGVTAFVASQRASGEFQHYIEQTGSLRFHRFTDILSQDYGAGSSWNGVQAEVERMEQISGQRVLVADAQGKVVGDSEHKLAGEPVNPGWARLGAGIYWEGRRVGVLYVNPVAGPDPIDLAFISALNRSVLLGALVAGLAAILVTVVLASDILRPVERLTAAARRMKTGDLTVRVRVDSQDEIGELANAFNAMAGSLAEQEQLRRNMIGDIAHELRTPLTNLRGYLEAARDGLVTPDAGLVDNLYEETMLLQRLVADLQELALVEAGQLALLPQPAELAAIAEQALGILRPQADAKGVTLYADMPADLPAVNVDPARIGQVLRNLLSNALLHTPAGGTITVLGRAGADEVSVSVCDTGSGVRPEDLPHVFDRFYRADKSRARQTGGAGLGLAIVKQLVLAHGGSVSANSVPGRGSTFTFTIPLSGQS
jgi:signal transduction histidine kinase